MQVDPTLDRTGAGLGSASRSCEASCRCTAAASRRRARASVAGASSRCACRSRERARRNAAERIAAPGRPRRILVVDDSADQAESLGLLLELIGNEVASRRMGRMRSRRLPSSIPRSRSRHRSAVMDGYEIARRLRQDAGLANLFLIALSGYAPTKTAAARARPASISISPSPCSRTACDQRWLRSRSRRYSRGLTLSAPPRIARRSGSQYGTRSR